MPRCKWIRALENRIAELREKLSELSVELNGVDEGVTRKMASVERRVSDLESRLSPPDPPEDIEINCRPPCPECGVCNGHNSSCSQVEEEAEEPKRWYVNWYDDGLARMHATIRDANRYRSNGFDRRVEYVEASAYDNLRTRFEDLHARFTESVKGGAVAIEHLNAAQARCDRLQAERDLLKDQLKSRHDAYQHALDCVDRVFQQEILPGFLEAGDDKFDGVIKLAHEYQALQAERDVLRKQMERFVWGCDWSNVVFYAKRCLELADAARRGDSGE